MREEKEEKVFQMYQVSGQYELVQDKMWSAQKTLAGCKGGSRE